MRRLLIILFLLMIPTLSMASIPQIDQKIDFVVENQLRLLLETSPSNIKQADTILSSLFDYQTQNNIAALPIASSLSLLRADPNSRSIENDIYWQFAKRLNRFSPDPHYFICQNTPFTPLLEKIAHCFTGLKLQWELTEGRLFLKSLLAHILFTTSWISALFLAGFFILRYGPFLLQYASAKFVWLSPIACGGIILIVLATLIFTFGWVTGFIFLTWILWKFISRFERYSLLFLYGLIAILPSTFHYPAQYLAHQNQHSLASAYTASKMDLTQTISVQTSAPIYQQVFQTLMRKVFFKRDTIQLQLSLAFGIIICILLGMFNQVGDVFFIFKRKNRYFKSLILRDLQAYPKLYFEFIKKLQAQDTLAKVLYNLVPPYYYFAQSKPLIALGLLMLMSFFFAGLLHSLAHFSLYSFTWHWIFLAGLLLSYIPLWAVHKTLDNRELYEKNTKNK